MIRSQRPSSGWRRRLTAADWLLLAAVALAQIAAAGALRVAPLGALRIGADRFRRLGRVFVRGSDERIAWAIEATGRRLGRLSTCLVRALVAQCVLSPNGSPLNFTIGVKRGPSGTLEAHAWLAGQDRVLVGAPVHEYVPVVSWPSRPGDQWL